MPLNPRQHNDAVNYMFTTLQREGMGEEDIAKSLDGLSAADRTRAFENAFKEMHQAKTGAEPSMAGSAVTGLGESATFSLGRVVQGAAQGVASALSGDGFKAGYESGTADIEDHLAYRELTNPKTYNLFNLAGYGVGLGKAVAEGGVKLASEAGLKGKAALAAAGASAMAVQGTAERSAKGEMGAKGLASDVALGAAAGPIVSTAVEAAAAPIKWLKSSVLGAYASAAKNYSKVIGSETPRAAEVVANLPDLVRIKQQGIALTKDNVTARSEAALTQVADYLDELKASVKVPEGEVSATAREVGAYLDKGLNELAINISEQAATAQGIAKKDLAQAFAGLSEMAKGAKANVSRQYGQFITQVEEAGANSAISVADDVAAFSQKLASDNVITESGKAVAGQSGEVAQTAFKQIFDAAKQPLNFKRANDLKKLIGESVDWDKSDATNLALKDLYASLRKKLTDEAKVIAPDVNVDKLFGEYQGALKVANKFENTFAGAVEEALPALSTLKKLEGNARQFAQLKPLDSTTSAALKSMIDNQTRSMQLGKYVDPNKLGSRIRAMADPRQADPARFIKDMEAVVGELKDKQVFFNAIDNAELPKQAKEAIKLGGDTFKQYISSLPPEMKPLIPSLQRMHDKVQKAYRIAGYKPNEAIELVANADIVDPAKLDDLRGLLHLKPELQAIMKEENLLRLAQSPEANVSMKPTKSLLGQLVTTGSISYAIGGPKLAALAVGLQRAHALLSQPSAARLLAERYKLVPSAKVASWANETGLIMNRILPAVRGQNPIKKD